MAGEPILVIDDHPTNLKLTRVILAAEEYDVRTAGSAEEALTMLETFTPRLIVVDLQLPELDGLELTRRLKADPARRGIVVLALSAYAMNGDEQKAFEAGCDGYATKPIEPDHLAAIVSRYLDRKISRS